MKVKELKLRLAKWFSNFLVRKPKILLGQELNQKVLKDYLIETTSWYQDVVNLGFGLSVDWTEPTGTIDAITEFNGKVVYLINVTWPNNTKYFLTLTDKNIRRFL